MRLGRGQPFPTSHTLRSVGSCAGLLDLAKDVFNAAGKQYLGVLTPEHHTSTEWCVAACVRVQRPSERSPPLQTIRSLQWLDVYFVLQVHSDSPPVVSQAKVDPRAPPPALPLQALSVSIAMPMWTYRIRNAPTHCVRAHAGVSVVPAHAWLRDSKLRHSEHVNGRLGGCGVVHEEKVTAQFLGSLHGVSFRGLGD